MNCDLFMQNIDAYFDDELPESTKLAFEEHKSNCVECNSLFESYKEMLSALNAMNEIDIPFPENLHDSIMNSVKEVAEQDAKSKSNVSNVIDITSYINDDINATNENTNYNKKRVFNSHKTNTLVAGFLTLFVATGAYKTYDTYKNNLLLDDSMLTVDLADDNSVADSTAQDTPTLENVQENTPSTALETTVNENTDTQTNEKTNNVDDSANLATTTQETEPTKANKAADVTNVNETTSTTDTTNDSSLSTEVSTFSVAEEEPSSKQGILKSSPKAKVVPMSTDADISIKLGNNINFEHFMTYLRNAPSLNIQLEDTSQPKASLITVSSANIEKLVDYIDNYPSGDVVVEYLNESLKNLNTHTNFKLKVVTEE